MSEPNGAPIDGATTLPNKGPLPAVSALPQAGQKQASQTLPGSVIPTTFFVNWRDPREGAFQVGAPRGWQVSGGTIRGARINPRHVVQAKSPDREIRVFLDDPDIQPHMVPNMMMRQHGFRDGQIVKGPAGPMRLARYLTGAQFAQQYIQSKLCPRPQISHVLDLANASDYMNARLMPIAAKQGKSARASVGEARFRCNGTAGYTMVNTLLLGEASGSGAQTWLVYQLGGFVVSDPAQEGFAWYVLNTMLETFR